MMESKLQAAVRAPQAQRTEALLELLNELLTPTSPTSQATDLANFASTSAGDAVGPVVSRAVLTEFARRIKEVTDAETRKDAIRKTLEALSTRTVSYEDQITSLREELAACLEGEAEWIEAAKVLQGIPLDSGQRVVSDEYKLKTYMHIVRLYLEDDDAVSAEAAFKRASLLIHSTQDKELQLSFKLSQARIFDSQRRFSEAASRYHELSYSVDLDVDDRLQALSAAVTCAIMAPAGPQRSRILAALYRDDRTIDIESRPILAATFLDHIIRPAQIDTFAATLRPHQLARLPTPVTGPDMSSSSSSKGKRGPETVLDRAMMEHNLLAASKIYANITLEGLGLLLTLTPAAAEAMARTMVQQGRLKASIDQVESVIMFEIVPRDVEGATSNVAAAAAASGEAADDDDRDVNLAPLTVRWDRSIRMISQSVEELAARIEAMRSVGVMG